MARKLVVEIVGDASSLERAFDRSAKSARKFNGDIDKAGRGAAAGSGVFKSFGRSIAFASGSFLGAAGLTAALKSSISAASDFAEEFAKTDAVFGESAKQVEDWALTTTKAFGISKRQALETASSFGALFAPIGIVGDQAAKQSEQLTQLGADLASFYNTNVQDALDAIRSGLVGESEPLRRYGVRLSETRVQQQAMADTGKDNAKALTEQEKALARLEIIFKDTTKAQGDFARSADRLPAQIKKAQANIDNLKVDLGTKLVPALSKSITWAEKFGHAMDRLGEGLQPRKRPFGLLGDWLGINPKQQKQQKPEDSTPWWTRAIDALGGPQAAAAAQAQQQGLQIFRFFQKLAKEVDAAVRVIARLHRTPEQLNRFFDDMISRKLFRGSLLPLKQQLVVLKQAEALITQRIKITKDITRKLNLEDELLQIRADQRSINEQLAADAAQAAQAARDEALAWADFAIERAAATKTLKDDLKAAEAKLALLKKQAGVGKKTAEQAREIWEAQQEVKRIREEMAKDERGGTRFKPIDVKSFIASMGLNLTPGQIRRLMVGLAQLGPGGTMPGGRSPAFAGAGVVVNGDVHVHGVQNTKQIEAELYKRAHRRAHHRRGG